jgi:hypothetical protein
MRGGDEPCDLLRGFLLLFRVRPTTEAFGRLFDSFLLAMVPKEEK